MDQVVVRKLESDIKPKLKARAALHGRSLEQHLRCVLRDEADKVAEAPEVAAEEGLGTQMAKLFEGIGFEPGEFDPDGMFDQPVRAAVFDD